MSKKILALTHVAYEGLGTLGEYLSQEAEVKIHGLYEKPFLDIAATVKNYDGFIIMGGPMSANDEATISFIKTELALIPKIIEADKPLLGICLGSQLIAKSLGAPVYGHPQGVQEIGWYPLLLTRAAAEDPIFKQWPQKLMMFQWHGETFDLPKGAVHLAESGVFKHQAFRYGKKVYGLQFHPEMTEGMIQDWFANIKKTPRQILSAAQKHLPQLQLLSSKLAKGFSTI
ncbi:MAG: gamma-glutamyl-gamma-aminobutyrate hydrolase family protein [Deltaproteobacteria bacterium]|nr:gamma-glutamyl-gamma-aminobutyrate hydrolase family protein [Deltaproteobacteria bacterium]